MLVLTRKRDEKIVINVRGEIVVLTVVEIRGDKVRVGAEAAEHIGIDRLEVYESKQRDRLRNQPRNVA